MIAKIDYQSLSFEQLSLPLSHRHINGLLYHVRPKAIEKVAWYSLYRGELIRLFKNVIAKQRRYTTNRIRLQLLFKYITAGSKSGKKKE